MLKLLFFLITFVSFSQSKWTISTLSEKDSRKINNTTHDDDIEWEFTQDCIVWDVSSKTDTIDVIDITTNTILKDIAISDNTLCIDKLNLNIEHKYLIIFKHEDNISKLIIKKIDI